MPAGTVCKKVLANDLNPASVEALRENIRINRVEDTVETFNMDAREFLRHLVDTHTPFHHVIMNLPASAASFLGLSLCSLRLPP